MPFQFEFEKYRTDVAHLKSTLETYGVAIIPSVLDDLECGAMEEGMWNTLEHWTQHWEVPIRRDCESSWRGIKDIHPKHAMLIQHYGIGHAQFIWDLRQNPKCVEPFAQLWDCPADQLLTSFDAASFHMPPEVTGFGWHKNMWLHSDQRFTRPGFDCVQSWVTARDVNEGDATLVVLEGSHLHHEDFGKQFGITDNSDWFKLATPEHLAFYEERGCVERFICCPKGSMVFWDSRTIHCGVEAQKGREKPNHRCVAYLCYKPRSQATPKFLLKKQKALKEMRMTNHWPCNGKLFAKMPHTYGMPVKPVVPLPAPVLNALGERLAGF
jgi:hypothetical protein